MISVAIGFKGRSIPTLLFVCNEWIQHGADRIVVANLGTERLNLAKPLYEMQVPTIGWHEGLAKNLAVLHAPAGIVITTNADIIPRFDIRTDAELLKKSTYIGPTRGNFRLTEAQTQQVLRSEEPSGELPGHRTGNNADAEGDYLMINREDFIFSRGYDPEDTGWGGSDTYFGQRLRGLGVTQTISKGTIWHLWHEHPGRDSSLTTARYNQKLRDGWWD